MAMEQYVNEYRVSEVITRAVQTLRNDRHKGRGIPYIKVGKSVRYAMSDVIKFMDSRKIQTDEM